MKLPFRANTATGDSYDIEFPLHPETGDAVRVSQLLSELLAVIDKDMALSGELSNGDVLQAVAMAMAIRTHMIHAPETTTQHRAQGLLRSALSAMAEARFHEPPAGHA